MRLSQSDIRVIPKAEQTLQDTLLKLRPFPFGTVGSGDPRPYYIFNCPQLPRTLERRADQHSPQGRQGQTVDITEQQGEHERHAGDVSRGQYRFHPKRRLEERLLLPR